MKRLIIIIMIILALAAPAAATDQTIAYTEEMVGSGHPTKSDTLNRLTLVEHNTDGTHKVVNPAYIAGCGVWPASTSSIYVRSGVLDIAGLKYTIDSTLTKSSLTGLSNDTLYRVYASAPGSGTALSATEITVSTTAAVWSTTYKCLMKSDAATTHRLIGVFLTDGSGNILLHNVDGQELRWEAPVTVLSASAAAGVTALSVIALSEFDTVAHFHIGIVPSGVTAWYFSIGHDGTTNRRVLGVGGSLNDGGDCSEMTNNAQIYYFIAANGGSATVTLSQLGLNLPAGLGR